MFVDLNQKEVSGWFDIKGGGRVHLRLRTEEDEREIRAACVTTAVEYPLLDGKYQRFETEKTDMERFVTMSWERNIKGWEGICDRKTKKAIPVTDENKVRLMKLVPSFREAYEEGLKALKKNEAAQAEELEKN